MNFHCFVLFFYLRTPFCVVLFVVFSPFYKGDSPSAESVVSTYKDDVDGGYIVNDLFIQGNYKVYFVFCISVWISPCPLALRPFLERKLFITHYDVV